MNETVNLMITRRSVRKFKSDMIPKEIIDEIITAGTYAASGRNSQSPIIIAVTNKELRDKIQKLMRRLWVNPTVLTRSTMRP